MLLYQFFCAQLFNQIKKKLSLKIFNSRRPGCPDMKSHKLTGSHDEKLCTNVILLLFGAPKGFRRFRGIMVPTDTSNAEAVLSHVVQVVQYPSLYSAVQSLYWRKLWRRECSNRSSEGSRPGTVVGYTRSKHKNKIRISKNWVESSTGN